MKYRGINYQILKDGETFRFTIFAKETLQGSGLANWDQAQTWAHRTIDNLKGKKNG